MKAYKEREGIDPFFLNIGTSGCELRVFVFNCLNPEVVLPVEGDTEWASKSVWKYLRE